MLAQVKPIGNEIKVFLQFRLGRDYWTLGPQGLLLLGLSAREGLRAALDERYDVYIAEDAATAMT